MLQQRCVVLLYCAFQYHLWEQILHDTEGRRLLLLCHRSFHACACCPWLQATLQCPHKAPDLLLDLESHVCSKPAHCRACTRQKQQFLPLTIGDIAQQLNDRTRLYIP